MQVVENTGFEKPAFAGTGRAMSTPTLAMQLEATGNRPAGFDYLRIILASAVVGWHTIVIAYGFDAQQSVWHGPFRPLPALILPMFFALSGFLVAGSLQRAATLWEFLFLRFIRIFPALVVEVSLSALVLGVAFTTLPLNQYFSSPEFGSYFFNVIGYIHYTLPGVFNSNPLSGIVNGQLWTVPFELECYILLSLLAVVSRKNLKYVLIVAALLIQAAYAGRALFGPPVIETSIPGRILVLTFLFGVTIFYWRDRIKWSGMLAALCAIVAISLLLIDRGSYFIGAPTAYLTIYLGLTNPKKLSIVTTGDYSYGIFLYGFPIQQAVAALWPSTWTWYANLLISLPIIALFSAASWHGVEKHALKLRKLAKASKPKATFKQVPH
jgi:peptidoglycan/LPS O-acetylase OafA/YrhL